MKALSYSKKLSLGIAVVLMPLLSSCPFADPGFTQAYYTFTTANGDLFATNSNYIIDNLYGTNENGYRRKFYYEGEYDGVNYFKIDSWPSSPLYIDYGNGDFSMTCLSNYTLAKIGS